MEKLLSPLDRVASYLSRASAAAASVSLFLMTWMIIINVSMRLIFNAPVAFVEEYSGFIYVFMIFMGFGWATRTDSHIDVSLVYDKLPRRTQDVMNVITSLLSLIVVGVYLFFGFDVFIDSIRTHEVSIITYTPFWIPKAAMCLGLLFFLLEVAVRVMKCISVLKSSTKESHATA